MCPPRDLPGSFRPSHPPTPPQLLRTPVLRGDFHEEMRPLWLWHHPTLGPAYRKTRGMTELEMEDAAPGFLAARRQAGFADAELAALDAR